VPLLNDQDFDVNLGPVQKYWTDFSHGTKYSCSDTYVNFYFIKAYAGRWISPLNKNQGLTGMYFNLDVSIRWEVNGVQEIESPLGGNDKLYVVQVARRTQYTDESDTFGMTLGGRMWIPSIIIIKDKDKGLTGVDDPNAEYRGAFIDTTDPTTPFYQYNRRISHREVQIFDSPGITDWSLWGQVRYDFDDIAVVWNPLNDKYEPVAYLSWGFNIWHPNFYTAYVSSFVKPTVHAGYPASFRAALLRWNKVTSNGITVQSYPAPFWTLQPPMTFGGIQ
jgi:hypothetical protein